MTWFDEAKRDRRLAARTVTVAAAAAGKPTDEAALAALLQFDVRAGLEDALEAGWVTAGAKAQVRANTPLSVALTLLGTHDALAAVTAARALTDDEERRALLEVAADPTGAAERAAPPSGTFAATLWAGLRAAISGTPLERGYARRLEAAAGDELALIGLAVHVLHAQGADEAAERLCDFVPQGAPVLVSRIQLLMDSGRGAEAEALGAKVAPLAVQADPHARITVLALEGRRAIDRGDHASARRVFSRVELQARAAGSTDLLGISRLAFAALSLRDGDVDASEKLAQASLELVLGNSRLEAAALYALAMAAMRQGRVAAAQAALDQALPRMELSFQRLTAYPNAMMVDTFLGDMDKAQARLDVLRKHSPRVPAAALSLALSEAFIAGARGDHARVLELLTDSHFSSSAPAQWVATAHWLRARALASSGKKDEARAALDAALVDPSVRQQAGHRAAVLLLDARVALLSNDETRAARSVRRVTERPEALRPLDFALQAALLELDMYERAGNVQRALDARRRALIAWAALVEGLDTDRLRRFESVFGRRRIARRLGLGIETRPAPYPWFIGQSPAFLELLDLLRRFAPSDATVLLSGETGTGKELAARALHELSGRAGPFVAFNCASVNDELLLSELFGHEKGAFTGAVERRSGRFESAHGGTLFLDEISELSARGQSALLRVLQERSFLRVGGDQAIRCDVRVVAAANRDLRRAVRAGEFREDLYFRLAGMEVPVPALRERGDDALLLFRHFLAQNATARGAAPKVLDPDAERFVREFAWPGNVRQLQNSAQAADLLGEERVVTAELLAALIRPELQTTGPQVRFTPAGSFEAAWLDVMRERGEDLKTFLVSIQRACIVQALEEARGNLSRAAQELGLSRSRVSQIVNGDEELRRRVNALLA